MPWHDVSGWLVVMKADCDLGLCAIFAFFTAIFWGLPLASQCIPSYHAASGNVKESDLDPHPDSH